MKIALRVFAALCLMWAVIAALVPCRPERRESEGAVKETWELVVTNSSPSDGPSGDKVVPIRIGTLVELQRRAEEPVVLGRLAQIFLWVSAVFAAGLAVTLIILSRKVATASDGATGDKL
jgi:hypothetical protein